ncbi:MULTISPECIES: PP2C family protein-serine/threonine phosphatase [Arthrobacter]|uniref:Protein phosphatase 2C domain-containing protein n=1 Tax=Arthrobacter caoxuetaonis TaxID=2886935 RepID=A0A9X1MCF9_9MICC|nr:MULTISPECIES: PP2C family serine/threonine-protein phosphatase [Arthrobacter]MCC3282428.1 protein phosphatase 2C domain-containing protein [Arthrobacter caoxuetaonis]MCC3297186.1 protein phosphatase 2C domain-containing protein [Arthrobacter caoxuetaonis]MCC9194075.1 protein phosphatase 2C domain-containing protein [Arthrobacter sp. zg-Y916]USQ58255.1 protein phosphatase 2C domain-containing protein [Arthrobacter caoxuetaonis]
MNSDETTSEALELQAVFGYASDRGLRRELNEDSLIAADPIFAVADGMGGHEAGEVASSICVRTLGDSRIVGEHLPQVSATEVEELLAKADRQIREATGGRAGTTLTGAVLVQEESQPYWLVFNVGDSRTYRVSRGVLEQITVDHSEVQELVDLGQITPDEALVHPRRHVVTRALGTGNDTEADFWLIPVEPGDRLMVCSDGLTGEVSDGHIFQILSSVSNPQDACAALVQAALRAGGRDNVTVLVVDAESSTGNPDSGAITLPGITRETFPAPGVAPGERPGQPEQHMPETTENGQ